MARFEHAPLERHEALAPFSRDHYVGLVQAQRMVHAAQADAVARRQALAEFLDAWDAEIAVHFADEERLLSDEMTDEERQRLLTEHQQLRELAEQARGLRRQVDPSADRLAALGRSLNDHIRWEERELFTRMQQRLSPEQLQRLARQTRAKEATRPRHQCRRGEGAE